MAVVSLLVGSLLTLLSRGSWNIGIAAWLAPIFMLAFIRSRSPGLALALGVLVYIAVHLIGWYRVIPFGGVVFVLVMTGIGLLHFLPFVADRLLAHRLPGFASTLVFPLALVAVEFLISRIGYGTWTHLAYTQYGNLPLMQTVSVTGLAGIVFLIGWVASTANWAWAYQYTGSEVQVGVGIVAAVLVCIHLAGALRLIFFPPRAETVRLAAITVDNMAAWHKTWHPLQRGQVLTPESAAAAKAPTAELQQKLLAVTEREARAGAKIVMWSEGQAMVLKEDEGALIIQGQRLAQRESIYLFMSFATVEPGELLLENKVVAIGPDGKVLSEQLKAHPTPGEGSVPGDGVMPVAETPFGRLATAICYDYDYPELIRQAGRAGADILLNPSWDSPAMAPLHTRMAVFRAVENGASMVRPTQDGLSMAVDHQGNVLTAVDYRSTSEKEQVMIAYLPKKGVTTLYSRIGDLFAWACVAGFLVLMVLALRRPV